MRNKRIELVPPFNDELIKTKSAKKQIVLNQLNKACLEEIELFNKGEIRQVTQKAVLAKVGKPPSWPNNQIGSHTNVKKMWLEYFDAINNRVTPEEKLNIQERYKELEAGKWVKITGWGDAAAAKAEIMTSFERAKK